MRYRGQIVRRFRSDTKSHHDVLYSGETQADSLDKACANIWFQAALAKSDKIKRLNAKNPKTSKDLQAISNLVGKFIQSQQQWDYKCEATEVDEGGQGMLSLESKLNVVFEFEDSPFTCCIAIFRQGQNGLELLAIQRKADPAKGQWALPGGHAEKSESPEIAAKRELAEETGVYVADLTLLRTREASPASSKKDYIFTKLIENKSVMPSDDAQGIRWIPIDELPVMAFGDDDIAKECANLLA